ncbi:MAG: NAD(P)H-quinone oxidoreductase [Pseudonocardiales bacterium]|nr:NAD(P)H-quinone oxidoreductase [Pseudonocardiales bacterium]MBV9031703.1 NAD(P)H-quinone oxidoreductase [Pseudonocardiales bacterium]MBW0011298.1 NAD(P)H-quinone oxidoreductase [Pseudonocardiales bacterium]
MHAITITEYGGPAVLRLAETPDPRPGPGEVLIDVLATSVNRADLLQRQGRYPPPPGVSEILGLECAGTVAGLGDGVTGFAVGDEVCALLAGGGYAERVAAPAGQVMPLPPGVDVVTAGGVPEVACTVWSTVVRHAGLAAGELLLVHGGSGGVGTHAIQVGRALGARVATTASAERLARCAELGAQILIDYREADFAEQLTGRVDVILDNMGAQYLSRNLTALAPDGRLVVIGLQGGATAELNLGALLPKRAGVAAIGLRGRPVDGPHGKAALCADTVARLWPMFGDGRVTPVVHATVPLAQAAQAHQMLEAGGVVGKILLTTRG